MKLNVAANNLPSTTVEGGRPRRSPRNRNDSAAMIDSKEMKEREDEVKLYKTFKKLEEKMDDLLSKATLPKEADNIDEKILVDRAKKYIDQSKEKVSKMYDRYQQMWQVYCVENNIGKKR